MYDIPTFGASAVVRSDYRKMTDRIFKKCVDDYKNSWYHKNMNIKVNPIPVIKYDKWWGHWSASSLIDGLIDMGVEVVV